MLDGLSSYVLVLSMKSFWNRVFKSISDVTSWALLCHYSLLLFIRIALAIANKCVVKDERRPAGVRWISEKAACVWS